MHARWCRATCDSPRLHRRRHFTQMETRSRSDERGRARRKSEPGRCADAADEGADANELNRLCREHLSRGGGAVAERAKPVTERAVFGCGRLGLGCETRVVIGVLVHRRHCKFVAVVGRVPAAQRARQDEDDRQCDKRCRAESQRTYHRNRAGRRRQGAGRQVVRWSGAQRENVPITGKWSDPKRSSRRLVDAVQPSPRRKKR